MKVSPEKSTSDDKLINSGMVSDGSKLLHNSQNNTKILENKQIMLNVAPLVSTFDASPEISQITQATQEEVEFVLQFPPGSAFTLLIDYLFGDRGKNENAEGYFSIDGYNLCYCGNDSSDIVQHNATIPLSNLLKYTYGPMGKTFKFSLNIRAVKDCIKSYKSRTITIRKDKYASNISITENIKSNGGEFISLLNSTTDKIYNFPVYSRGENNPNTVISGSKFKEMKTSINAKDSVVFTGLTDVLLLGIFRSGSTSENGALHSLTQQIEELQLDTEVIQKECIFRETLNGSIMKTICKLGVLAQTGLIKVYIEPEKDLKLVVPIGFLGTLRVYIKQST